MDWNINLSSLISDLNEHILIQKSCQLQLQYFASAQILNEGRSSYWLKLKTAIIVK